MNLTFNFDKVYIRPGFVDGRKGLNSLLEIIVNDMKLNPCDSALFMFCNKNKKILRCIYWHINGFFILSKKVEQQNWPWPKTEEEVRELNEEQLNMLLKGIDFWNAHKSVHYDMVI